MSVDRSSAACVSLYGHGVLGASINEDPSFIHARRDVGSEYSFLRSCRPISVASKPFSPLESSAVGNGHHTTAYV